MRLTFTYMGLLVTMNTEEETVGSEYVERWEVKAIEEMPDKWMGPLETLTERLQEDTDLRKEYWKRYRVEELRS